MEKINEDEKLNFRDQPQKYARLFVRISMDKRNEDDQTSTLGSSTLYSLFIRGATNKIESTSLILPHRCIHNKTKGGGGEPYTFDTNFGY